MNESNISKCGVNKKEDALLKETMIMNFYPMPHYLMRKHAIKQILKKNKCNNKDLLEIGYGAGEIFLLYIEFGLQIYGFDFSEKAFAYASAKFVNNKHIYLYENENEISQRRYDYVVACEVLEHIENDKLALEKWNSYLKDDGKLIISVPGHKNRWGASDVCVGHYRRYDKSDLIHLLVDSGFSIIDFRCYDFPTCIILDPLRNKRVHNVVDGYVDPNQDLKQSREQYSKLSGILRDKNPLVILFSKPIFFKFIIWFQELFSKTDFGSGFLVVCKKNKD